MDISKITDPKAKAFIDQFLKDREVNKEFYKRVPEDKFDFRMVDTPQRRSDSPRESLAHQIDTTRDYINGVRTGTLRFGIEYKDLAKPQKLTKDELLAKLEQGEQELVELLSDREIGKKKVKVPWSKESIPAVSSLWGTRFPRHTSSRLEFGNHGSLEYRKILRAKENVGVDI